VKRARKKCNVIGCTKLGVDGTPRCEDHPRQHGWGQGSGRTSDPEWQALRRTVLARDKGVCQIKTPGVCIVRATEVDHIDAVYEHGDRRDPDRLRGACKPCHAKRTSAQGHQAKKDGKVGIPKPPQPHRRPPAKQSAPSRIPRVIQIKY
jgi:5-methylcytosine-specific restriction protein A